MKKFFLVFFLFQWCLSLYATPRIYFLTGGVFERQSSVLTESIARLRKWLKESFPEIELRVIHNSHWKKICEELKEHNDFLGMIGHSFGAQAIVDIAHCLTPSKKEIRFFISLDAIQKPQHHRVDEIPNQIKEEINFFQNRDPFLRGVPNHRRKDGSHENIQNNLISLISSKSAHSLLVKTVLDNGDLYNYLERKMDGTSSVLW